MRRTGKEGLYSRVIGDKRGMIRLRFERAAVAEALTAVSSSGRTPASDPGNSGSNPGAATITPGEPPETR
jgi:hypothetical protein